MIPRHLTPVLKQQADKNPVVTLVGPRQSGKTTLVRATFPRHSYVSLERPDRRAAAMEDPLGFLDGLGARAILDEVQRAPDLLSYIQVAVDEKARPGQFILTGSQDLLLMKGVSQTLAGRTAVLRLLPFSLSELRKQKAIELSNLTTTRRRPAPKGMDLWETLWRGFYPRIHDQDLDPTRWLADYHRTYVDRDLRDVLRVMDLDAFERFVRLAAARTGTELNLSALAEDAGVTSPTAKQWLTALRIGSIVHLLQPHHENFRKRLRKRPKLHFLDTGLVCYLLGIESPQVLATHPLRGAIFESYVVSELTKAFEHAGRTVPLFHWRDATGHEIDVLLEDKGALLPVEAKSGTTVTSDMMKTVRWWLDLPGNRNTKGVIVYGGRETERREGITVVPWFLQ